MFSRDQYVTLLYPNRVDRLIMDIWSVIFGYSSATSTWTTLIWPIYGVKIIWMNHD
jgi:hypothetical protein